MRIALLIDADHWAPTTLYSLVTSAKRHGSVTSAAFGRLENGPYREWMGLYRRLGFELVPGEGKDVADSLLIQRAQTISQERSADEMWVATKDRPLLTRLSDALPEGPRVAVVEDPEARELPPRLRWESVAPVREPLPPNAIELIRTVTRDNLGKEGHAELSRIAERLAGFQPRDYGRESLRDLLRDHSEVFEVRESALGGAVRVRLRN